MVEVVRKLRALPAGWTGVANYACLPRDAYNWHHMWTFRNNGSVGASPIDLAEARMTLDRALGARPRHLTFNHEPSIADVGVYDGVWGRDAYWGGVTGASRRISEASARAFGNAAAQICVGLKARTGCRHGPHKPAAALTLHTRAHLLTTKRLPRVACERT